MSIKPCAHVPTDWPERPLRPVCQECVALGDRWVHLRLCLHCGHVGCCDDSKNRHATHHFQRTAHAVIQSVEPGEDWAWCYTHQRQVG